MKKTLAIALLVALGAMAHAQKPARATVTKSTEIFTVVEKNPEYPGGDEALYQFIASNIQYPEAAKADGKGGMVYLTFVIETDGTISDVKVLRSPHPALGEEAVRVVRLMPKWKPGKQRGKKVRVQYNLPINFQLQ